MNNLINYATSLANILNQKYNKCNIIKIIYAKNILTY